MSLPTEHRPVDAALVYAGRGWAVFPCHEPMANRGGCSCQAPGCGSPAKHPRVRRGLHQATTDRAQIRSWWTRWPKANVAVRTGAASGLVIVDIDPDHGGDDSLDHLLRRHGPLPVGRTIRTGSGGRHLYFAHPGQPVRNDTGRRLGAGIDIRGEGGYVIAPPSRHVSGKSYSVVDGGRILPEMPSWLTEMLLRPPAPAPRPRPGPSPATGPPDAWARAALRGELETLRDAAVGTRNHTLNRIAFRIGQIVGAGHLDAGLAEDALLRGAAAIGLGEREAVATVHSGLRAGEQSPRSPQRSPDSDPEVGLP